VLLNLHDKKYLTNFSFFLIIIKTLFTVSLLCYVSSSKSYTCIRFKKVCIRKIYHVLNFLGPYLNLDTNLCLYFDLEYRRLPLHIT